MYEDHMVIDQLLESIVYITYTSEEDMRILLKKCLKDNIQLSNIFKYTFEEMIIEVDGLECHVNLDLLNTKILFKAFDEYKEKYYGG